MFLSILTNIHTHTHTGTDAATSLAQYHIETNSPENAVSVLINAIQHGNRESIHIKLASVYRSTGKISEALSQYHAVLGISPHSREAKSGLQDLENLIREQKHNTLHTGGNAPTPIHTPPSMTRSGGLFS